MQFKTVVRIRQLMYSKEGAGLVILIAYNGLRSAKKHSSQRANVK